MVTRSYIYMKTSANFLLYKCYTYVARCRTMVQAVSRRPLTAEARFRARVSRCEIYGKQSGTGTGFSPSSSCLYHSIMFIYVTWGMTTVYRHSLNPSIRTTGIDRPTVLYGGCWVKS
jgi:hypothetical protein